MTKIPEPRILGVKANNEVWSHILFALPPYEQLVVYSGRKYRIQIPNMIWAVRAYKSNTMRETNVAVESCYFMKEAPTTKGKNLLYKATFPNVYRNGHVCCQSWDIDGSSTTADICQRAVSGWWETRFNSDVTQNLLGYSIPGLFRNWEASGENEWLESTEITSLSSLKRHLKMTNQRPSKFTNKRHNIPFAEVMNKEQAKKAAAKKVAKKAATT